ncbi:MAG: BBE domain-containing protein [Anaerolineales bacterium]
MLILPATADVINGFIAEAEAAPDELSTIVNIMPAPPMPFLPKEVHGKLVLTATLVYAGDVDTGERVIAPFRKLATPLADLIKPMRYPEIYPHEDHGSSPIIASRAMFVNSVDRWAAEKILNHLNASTASMAFAQLRVLGGAVARIPADATAFAHRSSRIMVNLMALYGNPGEKTVHETWVADFAAALQQDDGGVYVNFLGDEGEARIHAAYPDETWKRLAKIKARYDLTNFFHLNQNIQPRE